MSRMTKIREWKIGETMQSVRVDPATMPEFRKFEADLTKTAIQKYGPALVIVQVSAVIEITLAVDGPLSPADIADADRYVSAVETTARLGEKEGA